MVIKLLLKHFAFKQKHIDSFEEGPTLLWVEQVADVSESLAKGVKGSGADASQVGLEFREGHLDGIEIGAVSRQ